MASQMAHQIKIPQPAGPKSSAQPLRMTFQEFLNWADEDTWAEWVNGQVVFLSPVSDRHQDLSDFLIVLFRLFAEKYRQGVVRSAPFLMKTGPDLPGREPDLIFVARKHRKRIRDVYLDGPADLAIEITSPDSQVRDRREKLREYQRGGVPEYWIVDPIRKQAQFHVLGKDGLYRPAPVGEDDIFRSVVLKGLWIKVAWLWQRPLPPIMSVLEEWGWFKRRA